MIDYSLWVGKKVRKKSGKPFLSHSSINTVVAVETRDIPQSKSKVRAGEPATKTLPVFRFLEDPSFVQCDVCVLVE